MSPKTTSDAWVALDEALGLAARLERDGACPLTAEEIKRHGQREPRLMTKFDTKQGRPPTLAGATILPVRNGEYMVLRGDGYHVIPAAREVKLWRVSSERLAQTRALPWFEEQRTPSESQVIDMAWASGALADFLRERELWLTVRGRLRSPRFAFGFKLHNKKIRTVETEGVQIEVDAGLEGAQALYLIEAKVGSADNLITRQLYYPYRMWRSRLPGREIAPVYCGYSNGKLSLRRYAFEPEHSYHGIAAVAAVDYILVGGAAPEPLDLAAILEANSLEALPEAPFPQSDSLDRVVDAILAVRDGENTRDTIAERYAFSPRQARYYANAAVFLGFLERKGKAYALTEAGRVFGGSSRWQRMGLLIGQMARRPVLRSLLEYLMTYEAQPMRSLIAQWIAKETQLSGDTVSRRAGTIATWGRWVEEALAESRQG